MMTAKEIRSQIEAQRRSKLQMEKPYVYEKIMKYKEKEDRGECTAVIDFCFDYACNMNCRHCCNLRFSPKERALSLEDVRALSDQADRMGLAQFNVSGGEPLVFEDFDQLIEALNPEKFHIAVSTNGLLLDRERASHLKAIGVDKVKISLDSIDEAAYAATRNQQEGHSKALQALFHARDAGLQACVQTVVSHQNAQSEATERLARFCQENGFNMDVMIAKAVGRWEGKEDVLIDEADAKQIAQLKGIYPLVNWDVLPTYERTKGGCIAIKKILHITKYGDVLPCGFIHIAIGNIFEEPLQDIISRGLRIKYFKTNHPTCLAGMDRAFIRQYMSKFYGRPLPIHWTEAFGPDDFDPE